MENTDDVGAGEHDAELESELCRVGANGNLALLDGSSRLGFEKVTPLSLDASNLVVDSSGASAELAAAATKKQPPGKIRRSSTMRERDCSPGARVRFSDELPWGRYERLGLLPYFSRR